LESSAVAIAPLRISRGIQNKVIEAMAMGRPVLATRGALTGLSVQPGEEAVCADDAPQWAAELVSLFADEDRRRRVGAAAREYVLRQHAWDRSLAPLWDALSPPSIRKSASELAIA
jgi:glycosyltransferase involved in cell wall biosynthesis